VNERLYRFGYSAKAFILRTVLVSSAYGLVLLAPLIFPPFRSYYLLPIVAVILSAVFFGVVGGLALSLVNGMLFFVMMQYSRIPSDWLSYSLDQAVIFFCALIVGALSDRWYALMKLLFSHPYGEGSDTCPVEPVDRREFVPSARLIEETLNARRETERQIRITGKIFENSTEGVMVTNENFEIQMVNPAFNSITGYSQPEVVGKTPKILHSGKHGPDFYAEMRDSLDRQGRWQGEIWNRRKNGDIYPEWLTISTVRDEEARRGYYIGIFRDIGALKQKEAQIEHNAYYDQLTDLPNRLLFNDRLNLAVTQAGRKSRRLGIMLIDLDDFKKVNDTLGHAAGDLLLKDAGRRLLEVIRAGDTLARTGGDEFTLLLPDIQKPDDVTEVAGRVLQSFRRGFYIDGNAVYVTPSMGISLFPDDGTDAKTLLKCVDLALLQAKEKDKNTYQFFTSDLNERAVRRLTLENVLREALSSNWLHVHYQPIVELATGKVVSSEALVRLKDPVRGLIPPVQFISLAEETGLIYPLGEWVFRTACRQNRTWNDGVRGEGLRVAINLSAKQFLQPDLLDRLKVIFRETQIDPHLVTVEITENSIIKNIDASIGILNQLKNLGVNISIDDFGTGYSSLTYLKKLPIDILKIDQSFVQDLLEDPNDASIVNAIISMAHSLNLKVVAEGVENEGQLEALKEQGCNYGQGFLFSRPVAVEEFLPLLTR